MWWMLFAVWFQDLFSLNEQTNCDTHELLKCPCKNSQGEANDESRNKLPAPVRQCQLGTPQTEVEGQVSQE